MNKKIIAFFTILGLVAFAIKYLMSEFPDLIESLDDEEGFEYD